MDQNKTAIMLMTAIFALAGCSNNAPNCSDQKVLDTLTQLPIEDTLKGAAVYSAKMKAQNKPPEEIAAYDAYIAKSIAAAKNAKTIYTNIVTTEANDKTGFYACAATVEVTAEGKTNKWNFTYTVEKTNDGKSFHVNSKGLIK